MLVCPPKRRRHQWFNFHRSRADPHSGMVEINDDYRAGIPEPRSKALRSGTEPSETADRAAPGFAGIGGRGWAAVGREDRSSASSRRGPCLGLFGTSIDTALGRLPWRPLVDIPDVPIFSLYESWYATYNQGIPQTGERGG